MTDPLATAYAAPKSDSAGPTDHDREARVALQLASGFLIVTVVIQVGQWLVRVLPMWGVEWRSILIWFLPWIANGVSAVYLLRGRRRVVWLPVAIITWRELRSVWLSVGVPMTLQQKLLPLAILALYVGVLLLLTWRRPGRTRIGGAVAGIAAYLILIGVEWFDPIVIYLPPPDP